MNAHSIAVKAGYAYIRGAGKVINGVWYSRFTRTSDGVGPALYVGWNVDTGWSVVPE